MKGSLKAGYQTFRLISWTGNWSSAIWCPRLSVPGRSEHPKGWTPNRTNLIRITIRKRSEHPKGWTPNRFMETARYERFADGDFRKGTTRDGFGRVPAPCQFRGPLWQKGVGYCPEWGRYSLALCLAPVKPIISTGEKRDRSETLKAVRPI